MWGCGSGDGVWVLVVCVSVSERVFKMYTEWFSNVNLSIPCLSESERVCSRCTPSGYPM